MGPVSDGQSTDGIERLDSDTDLYVYKVGYVKKLPTGIISSTKSRIIVADDADSAVISCKEIVDPHRIVSVENREKVHVSSVVQSIHPEADGGNDD